MIQARAERLPTGWWVITADDWDGQWIGEWQFEEQAEMAAMLVREDGLGMAGDENLADIGDAVREAVSVEVCASCEKQMMACQMLTDVCTGCTP